MIKLDLEKEGYEMLILERIQDKGEFEEQKCCSLNREINYNTLKKYL